jgi:hypothetical protein
MKIRTIRLEFSKSKKILLIYSKTYIQLLGALKGMRSELTLYYTYTVDAAILKKQEERQDFSTVSQS